MKNAFAFRWNTRIGILFLLFLAASVLVYMAFFDILVPRVPDASYKGAVGLLFLVPVLIMAVGQTVISGFVLHLLVDTVNPRKSNLLRALFVASVLVFLFSLTYAIFPEYGPFYYVIFIYGAPWYTLPLEIGYSIFILLFTTFLAHRTLHLPLKISFVTIFLLYFGIMAAAS